MNYAIWCKTTIDRAKGAYFLMEKKKAIKIVTATAIAASAFTAVAPAQSEAAVSVKSQVSASQKAMKKPYTTYTQSKSLVSASVVKKQIAAAKSAQAKANTAIKNSKSSAKVKAGYYKQIKAYSVFITRAQGYVNAITLNTRAEEKALAAAIEGGKLEEVTAARAALNSKLYKYNKAVAKVYSKTVRDLLNKTYAVSAKEVNEEAIDFIAYAAAKEKADAYVALANGDLSTQAKIDAAKAAKAAIDLTKLNATDKASVEAADVKVAAAEEALKVPVVESVSATNATTVTIKGTGLKNLKAEDVTVAGAKVTTVQSTDGLSATVTLEGTLPANTDVKVTVKDSVGTKDYTVKFGFEPKAVAVSTATYDDDTKGQKVAVTVDGVATSVDYLLAAGYSVTFNAYDKDGKLANTTLFGTALDVASTDGKINGAAPITAGDYKVQVVIAKGSTVLTSERATITVRNIDNSASAINSYELTNFGVDKVAAAADNFKQSSSTLVFGDVAQFNKVVIGSGSSLAELAPGTFTLKSSDESVVSVDSATGTVTAEGLGTAKVTITVGTVAKEVTLTVKGEARKATLATPAANSIKAIVGGNSDLKVKVTDQYGDPVVGATGLSAHFPTSITGLTVAGPTALVTDTKGEVKVSLAGLDTAGQTGTVQIKKDSDGTVLGSFTVTTTAVDNSTVQKLAYDSSSESKDDSINAELGSDDTISYKVSTYTSENVFKADLVAGELTGYNVKFNGKVISVNGDTDGDYTAVAADAKFDIAIVDAGTTTLSVYKPDGTLVGTKTITVAKGEAKITSVAWKAAPTIDYSTTINYKTVLDITEAAAGSDDIVKGITLSSPVLNKIRIDNTGVLYIDKNDDGSNNDSANIGTLTYAVASNASATNTVLTPGLTGSGYTGLTVATGTPEKGNMTFIVTDTVSSTPVTVSTKAVSVDVK